MLFLTLLYAWQHLPCMVSAYITLCWSVCACCCNLRAFLKAETLPVYANYVDWGHLKWHGPITFDKLEILLQPGQNEQLKMSTQFQQVPFSHLLMIILLEAIPRVYCCCDIMWLCQWSACKKRFVESNFSARRSAVTPGKTLRAVYNIILSIT